MIDTLYASNYLADLFLSPSCNCLSKALECLPTPDVGIYFDVSIDNAIHRIEKRCNRTGTLPHYSESKESLIRKKRGYEDMMPNETYPILKIDANQRINKVYASITGTLKEVCPYIYSDQINI